MGKRRVTVMLDQTDISELEAKAQSQRVSLAWVIRDAVKTYLTGRGPIALSTEGSRSNDRSN